MPPSRAIDSGLIDRFGYIDPDMGGETTRIGLTGNGQFGGSVSHRIDTALAGMPLALTFGADGRWDHIGKVGLYHSVAGQRTSTIRQDAVDEYCGALFGQADLSLTLRLRLMLGLRGDLWQR